MAFSIEKWKTEERVRTAILRYRGNLLFVAKELKLDVEYVRRIQRKMHGKSNRDTSVLVANTLAQQILMGYESRVSNWMAMLETLSGKETALVSLCCKAPVFTNPEEREWTDIITYICMECHQRSEVKTIDKTGIYKLKESLLIQLREEDIALVNFAEKLGYTNKEPEIPAEVHKTTQNILVIKGGSHDEQMVNDLQQLSPTDREKIRKELTQQLLTLPVDTATEGPANGK